MLDGITLRAENPSLSGLAGHAFHCVASSILEGIQTGGRSAAGPKNLGELLDEEKPQAGHTCADNPDIDFNRRPKARGPVIPCWIDRVCKSYKTLEPYNADDSNTLRGLILSDDD